MCNDNIIVTKCASRLGLLSAAQWSEFSGRYGKPATRSLHRYRCTRLTPGPDDVLLRAMDIDLDSGVLRMSFVHYTSMAEIEHLIRGLTRALEMHG
jgi:selenocysteine lyase/cysteine desulfurase